MTIQRFETGPRMSQAVVHGDTVYLAGIVANNAGGESVTRQTQDVLATIDSHLKKAGTDKSKLSILTMSVAAIPAPVAISSGCMGYYIMIAICACSSAG